MALKLNPALSFAGRPAPAVEGREGIPLYLCPIQAGFPSPADDFMDGRLDLPFPSADTALFLKKARGALNAIWKPGYRYARGGVMLFSVEREEMNRSNLSPARTTSWKDLATARA